MCEFKLIGITGDFIGNEERLHFCFPIFEDKQGVRRVAQSANWKINDSSTWDLISHDLDLSLIGTEIDIDEPIWAREGTIVGIIGSKFFEWLKDLDVSDEINGWFEVKNGFYIFVDSYDKYEDFSRRFADKAIEVFDRELKRVGGKWVSEKARHAGNIIMYSSCFEFIRRAGRILVMKWCSSRASGDEVEYIRALEMASRRLHKSYQDINTLRDMQLEIYGFREESGTNPHSYPPLGNMSDDEMFLPSAATDTIPIRH